MVLRCSLLGHDYGDTEVDREREERGSEVVVTVQEYEECARCGDRTVISENTEVTSLTTGTDADIHPDESDIEPEPDTETTDAEFIDAEADEGTLVDADADPDSAAAPDTAQPDADSGVDEPMADTEADEIDVPTDENGDPVTDDGEILDDDDEPATTRSDRGHGEWPDSDDVGPPVGSETDPETWPEDDADSEAAPIEDDAVVLETDTTNEASDDSEPIGVDATPPDADAIESEQGGDPTAETGSDSDGGTGIERAKSAPAPTEGRKSLDEDTRTELYCPRCDFVAGSDRSSLRTGDICSECRKGYLSERTR